MLYLVNPCYSTEDWRLMQRALAKASEALQRCPKSHENADRLARTVMKLFDQGLRDEMLIAAKAAEQEMKATNIASYRDSMVS